MELDYAGPGAHHDLVVTTVRTTAVYRRRNNGINFSTCRSMTDATEEQKSMMSEITEKADENQIKE